MTIKEKITKIIIPFGVIVILLTLIVWGIFHLTIEDMDDYIDHSTNSGEQDYSGTITDIYVWKGTTYIEIDGKVNFFYEGNLSKDFEKGDVVWFYAENNFWGFLPKENTNEITSIYHLWDIYIWFVTFLIVGISILLSGIVMYKKERVFQTITLFPFIILGIIIGIYTTGWIFFWLEILFYPAILIIFLVIKKKEKRDEWRQTIPGLFDTGQTLLKKGDKAFTDEDFRQAMDFYEKSEEAFEKVKEGAIGLGDNQLSNSSEKKINVCRSNINQCNIALDKITVEELTDEAVKQLHYAKEDKNKGNYFKNRDNLKSAHDTINRAFDISNKNNFKEAGRNLKNLLQEVRGEMNNIEDLITGDVKGVVYKDIPKIHFDSKKKRDKKIEWDGSKEIQTNVHRTRRSSVDDGLKSLIPGYVLKQKIGSGGFATVYQATDKSGGVVAIKLPKFLDSTLDMSIYDKFQKEANIWMKLDHKNIVEVFESAVDPLPYISMELMEGENLLMLINKRPLSINESINIMLQLLDAISYAHRMGVIHRDIKPENILFTSKGIPKITDWGIGKFMVSQSATKTVGTKGTLLYSAPEQISKKKFGSVDWSTDIFQLGIVFYEMLTNENPFYDEDSAGIMNNILYEEIDSPSYINSEVPEDVDYIVMNALEKRKEDRWRSADIMYHELRRIKHY